MAEQGHALISPSAGARISVCPASVLLSLGVNDEGSPYAAEGTLAHRYAELLAREDGYLLSRWVRLSPLTDEEKTELAEFQKYAPDEMHRAVRDYVSYLKSIIPMPQDRRLRSVRFAGTEVRVPLTTITGEADAYGTADFICIEGATIHIVDFKYGAGKPVTAEHNVQLSLYAAAALDAYDMEGMEYGITEIELHIVQPRASGGLSRWPISRAELNRTILPQFQRAAARALRLVEQPADLRVSWPFQNDDAGDFCGPTESADACQFCRAKVKCPALKKYLDNGMVIAATGSKAEQTASVPTVVHEIQAIPVPTDPQSLGRAFLYLDGIETWCKAVRASALKHLEQGTAVPGLKLVSGRAGPRKWVDDAAVESALKGYLKVDELYEKKVISPTAAEKLMKTERIGKTKWKQLQELITRKGPGVLVVPESDPREPVKPELEDAFDDLE